MKLTYAGYNRILNNNLRVEFLDRRKYDEDKKLQGVYHGTLNDNPQDGKEIQSWMIDHANPYGGSMLAPYLESNQASCYCVLGES